jgi:hypothetical protein
MQNLLMSEYCNIKAVVLPPVAAGKVLLTGAAELVADTILDLDVEMDYFEREVALDGAGVTCIKVELENELPEEMSQRIQAALANLIDGTQELTGWTSSVNLVQATDDGQEEPGSGDLDAEGEKLLPSGEQLAASLLEDIRHEEAVYTAADLFQALPLEDLCTEDLDGLGSAERTAAMRRASALAGCLIYAADIVIDELIDDIVNLRDEESDASTSTIEDTWVLCQLPARFAVGYTPLFAQKFLVAVVDVTGRLTKGSEPLACVAQELGLRVLLNQVEVVAESADVALDDGWRGHLEEMLFEDLDHEMLYDPAYDGIEDDPASQPPGMAPMRFEDWFKPFNEERTMPPYALSRASSAKPDTT